jgi:hypothetical protein
LKVLRAFLLLGLLAVSFVMIFPSATHAQIPHVFAASPSSVIFLNTTLADTPASTPAACGSLVSSGNVVYPMGSLVPGTTTSGSGSTMNFCGTTTYLFGNSPFVPTSVEIKIWGYNVGTAGTVTVTLVDLTSASTKIFQMTSGVSDNFNAASPSCATAGELDFFVPPGALQSNSFNPAHTFEAIFSFSDTAPPAICTGGSLGTPSQIVLTGSPLVTPEFPFGTILAIIAPIGAIGAYMLLKLKFAKPALATVSG